MIRCLKYSSVICAIIVLGSCAGTNMGNEGALDKQKDQVLVDSLVAWSNTDYDYFYSKISTKFTDSSQSVSFKTSARIIADTSTNLLITYARIPIVNAVVSKDSVKMTNKRDKCYITESIGFLKEQFKVDFTLKNLEELFIGLPLGFDPSEKYYQLPSTEQGYIMSSHSKRDLNNLRDGKLDEMVVQYTISQDLKRLVSTTIISPNDSAEITLNYTTRELIDGVLLPKEVAIDIQSKGQHIELNLEYRKSRLNQVETIFFVIPESYEKCR